MHSDIVSQIKSGNHSELFELHYQPQYAYSDNQYSIYGAEVLFRLYHNGETIYPSEFIKKAEEYKLLDIISIHAVKSCAQTLAIWAKDKRYSRLILSLNVTPTQLMSCDFIRTVKRTIKKYSFKVENLCIEITESTPLDYSQSFIQNIEQLKKLGLKVSLDDFGTECSTLSSLLHVPADELKIDMIFVLDENFSFLKNKVSRKIINFIVGVSACIGASVIAEGVETQEQLDELLAIGISRFQGYYFSEPLPFDEFIAVCSK